MKNKLNELILEARQRPEHERLGQSYMNVLRRIDYQAYQEVSGGIGDCFYSDKKIPAFCDVLQEIWNRVEVENE